MSELNVNTIKDASGGAATEYQGLNTAEAWCQWSVAAVVQDSYNVDDVTDNALGDWTVNLTDALADNNGVVAGLNTGTAIRSLHVNSYTTTAIQIEMTDTSGSNSEASANEAMIVVFSRV